MVRKFNNPHNKCLEPSKLSAYNVFKCDEYKSVTRERSWIYAMVILNGFYENSKCNLCFLVATHWDVSTDKLIIILYSFNKQFPVSIKTYSWLLYVKLIVNSNQLSGFLKII